MHTAIGQQRHCGREFTAEEVSLIQEIVQTCTGISRMELACTVCEVLEWKRAGGGLKARECRDLLERLESQGVLTLPSKKSLGAIQSRKSIAPAGDRQVHSEFAGSVEEFTPIDIELVQSRAQRLLFQELLSGHHYLGYAMPYGARLQYLCYVSRPRREVIGCMQFSSPAWRMKLRDQWIGWDDRTRGRHLQHVVTNSRFLVLGKIRNLASTLLSCALRRLRTDWQVRYGVDPWLVETLVDRERFHGGCYRAANFIVLGETSGRGRMDRTHQRHGAEVKTVLVYPLVKDAVLRLRETQEG
ncbi:MAG: DUF4338 domain-containing protein [Candidatus Omnitrophica bacterium]|nr:DUF4338 domain-containing protein [Candidatus Omnitrophota bacterium]